MIKPKKFLQALICFAAISLCETTLVYADSFQTITTEPQASYHGCDINMPEEISAEELASINKIVCEFDVGKGYMAHGIFMSDGVTDSFWVDSVGTYERDITGLFTKGNRFCSVMLTYLVQDGTGKAENGGEEASLNAVHLYSTTGFEYIFQPEGMYKIKDKVLIDYYDVYNSHKVIVPDGIQEIGDDALGMASYVETVEMPDTVTAIGEGAFGARNKITNVRLSKNITYIGVAAFSDCYALESIVLPATLKTIDERAFCNCNSLEKVYCSDGIESISDSAFSGCRNLTEINLPDSVKKIGERAFYECSSLKKLFLPKNIESIGDYAFGMCGSLEELTIPADYSGNLESVFSGYSKLQSIKVDPANKVYDSRNNSNAVIETKTGTLILGSNKTVIPEGVKNVRFGAFDYNAADITSIVIPEGVISLEGCSINCPNLKTIYLPSSLKQIGTRNTDTFYGYTEILLAFPSSVKEVFYSGSKAEYEKIEGIDYEFSKDTVIHYNYGQPEEIKNPFTDIPDGTWYTDAVLFCYKRGAMTGLTTTTFGPKDNLSRAMTVQLLWKLEGSVNQKVSEKPFPDVAVNHWSANAITWAKKNNIAGGYTSGEKAGQFGRSDNITRQEFIKILYAYAKFKGYNTSVKSATSYKKVSDSSSVSSWAVEAMNWGYENELIANGSDFKSKDPITRRETATIIARFLRAYE